MSTCAPSTTDEIEVSYLWRAKQELALSHEEDQGPASQEPALPGEKSEDQLHVVQSQLVATEIVKTEPNIDATSNLGP